MENHKHLPFVVFILSRSYAEAEEYARCCLDGRQEYTFIEDADQLRGLRGIHFVKTGEWRQRADLETLKAFCIASGAVDMTRELPVLKRECSGSVAA